MRRVILLQVVLAMVCALVLGHLGDQLVQGRADYVHAQRGAK